jgi:hypothetical protein
MRKRGGAAGNGGLHTPPGDSRAKFARGCGSRVRPLAGPVVP